MKQQIVRLFFIQLLLIFLVIGISQAVTLDIHPSTRQLMGANEVLVQGSYYDVDFIDGIAQDIFYDGSLWNFTFNSAGDAFAASNALLDSVINGPTTPILYTTDPEWTNGIESDFAGLMWTPYLFQNNAILTAFAANIEGTDPTDDEAGISLPPGVAPTFTTIGNPLGVWAVWTPAQPVPEPTTILLLGTGLIGLAALTRRFKM